MTDVNMLIISLYFYDLGSLTGLSSGLKQLKFLKDRISNKY